ncbi:MAG: aldolase/citrate lyase family protein [Devosia sp.]|nr:aldolase/citrate lyase family protein [Devosia sp.]
MSDSFRHRMREGRIQIGLFMSLNSLAATEAVALSGYDYAVFDAEHSPMALPVLHGMLSALACGGTEAVVRTASHDVAAIKHYLDLGVKTLMFPNVNNAEQAAHLVRATRYPPEGFRGVAGTIRASRYGRDKSYLQTANAGITVWAQIESREGLAHVDEIAATPGVDGIYFGPNDMSADFGTPGQPGSAANVARITDAVRRVRAAGKAAGILCGEAEFDHYADAGVSIFAFASDAALLVRSADALAAKYAAQRGTRRAGAPT